MRLITTIEDQVKGAALSAFLTTQNILNQLELVTDTDWGSTGYGNVTCRIWVIDEDQVPQAMQFAEEFRQNPNDTKFAVPDARRPPPLIIKPAVVQQAKVRVPARKFEQQPLGMVTVAVLFICALLFMIQQVTAPEIQKLPAGIPYTPVVTPTVNKELLYDYPKAFEIIDSIVSAYGIGQLQAPTEKPVEVLLDKFHHTPYWKGIYSPVVSFFKEPGNHGIGGLITSITNIQAPMFEKIREGEVWRLFTPALMHYDWLHIIFNMLWVIVLGKQLEQRLGGWRYALFILITGIFSNTAQYLMSGGEFLGFSGIICAMLSFVWMRQRLAAWEGYRLEGSTMAFMMFFLFTILTIQAISFVMEINSQVPISPGIANTAHMAGLASGAILGCFRWRN